MPLHIKLIPRDKPITVDDLTRLSPGPIIACDFPVEGVEKAPWSETDGGYACGRIINVDHHADTTEMRQQISSAHLAIKRVKAMGLPTSDTIIVINHTDCDSVLSAGIMSGRLAADDRYGDAALAADHTGDENLIADLLQALDKADNFELSFAALARLESGQAQTAAVEEKVADRLRKRQRAAQLVDEGAFLMDGQIAFARLPEALDGEFFAPLLPLAVLIAIASPHPTKFGMTEVKVRLGKAAGDGASLHALSIPSFDPNYRGRWNAGSDKRLGGTGLTIEDYVSMLRSSMASLRN